METPTGYTEEMLNNVLVNAVEGGTGYWAQCSDYRWNMETWGTEYGVILYEIDGDNPEKGLPVTREVIIRGLTRTLADPRPGVKRHAANLLAGDDDVETGDVIVQMALFGDVIYS